VDEALTAALFCDVLERARDTPADRVPELVRSASARIGVIDSAIYLVDYSQYVLCPIDPATAAEDELPIEGTLAGRAFSTQTRIDGPAKPGNPAGQDGPDRDHRGDGRCWVPLTDGSARLGVVMLTFETMSDKLDTVIECLARLIADVIVSKDQYSDWFMQRRRRQDLSLAADMQWRQLPPLTYTTPKFCLAAILEPAYDIGGDAFDYAHHRSTLNFNITDAMGRGTNAVFLSTAATASFRHSRAHDAGLAETYRAADVLLRRQFPDNSFVTAVIAELDGESGVLRWVNAGHPCPLLVRDRTVIGELACRPSLPLGLGGDLKEIAEQSLQSGDRILFYTDGVVEAHERGGPQFGVDRLIDLLLRATLDEVSPAETMRRLSLAVMSYNDDRLDDDATMLMLEIP
jgi:hypothetical protein